MKVEELLKRIQDQAGDPANPGQAHIDDEASTASVPFWLEPSVLNQRPSLVRVIAGVTLGLFVAVVVWVYLFAQFEVFAPPRYPTFDAARPVAVEETAKYRWPGSSIRVRQVDAERFVVERRWLGLRESVVKVA